MGSLGKLENAGEMSGQTYVDFCSLTTEGDSACDRNSRHAAVVHRLRHRFISNRGVRVGTPQWAAAAGDFRKPYLIFLLRLAYDPEFSRHF
jgi:hypothetical protein